MTDKAGASAPICRDMESAPPFLAIRNVTKVFSAARGAQPVTVIDDVSMTIEEGELIVFLGPS